uniref:Uncharacterized protein n=1 Tax=Branchiostoma floridae TaxID=7739 RepID=C3YWI4_BRAFL|eukprot:XP_002599216.1 hypothetical protein BRAFLDRAFT_64432 [Branchiostoma floridae]
MFENQRKGSGQPTAYNCLRDSAGLRPGAGNGGMDQPSSELRLYSSSELHLYSSSELHLYSSSELHLYSSSELHLYSSSELHLYSSSLLHSKAFYREQSCIVKYQ